MAKLIRKILLSANAPKPVGPYSQAVQVGNNLYVSGVLGMDKDSMKLVPGGAAAEAKQALVNLKHILSEANITYKNVVKATVFLDDLNDFSAINEVYKTCFKEPYPARSCFQIGKLPMGAKIEIEAIAVIGDIVDEK